MEWKRTTSPEGYLSAKVAAKTVGIHPTRFITLCEDGEIKGSLKHPLGRWWIVPEETVDEIILKQKDISDTYYTVKELAEKLDVSASSIRELIKRQTIKEEVITIFQVCKTYIPKQNPKVLELIQQKESIDKRDFVDYETLAAKFNLSYSRLRQLVNEGQLSNKEKFCFFTINYVKIDVAERLLQKKIYYMEKESEGYLTLKRASERLGIGIKRLMKNCREGKIPDAIRIGLNNKMWLIPSSFIEKAIEVKKQYLSISEFSENVGQTVSVVRSKIKDGRIPEFEVNGTKNIYQYEKEWLIPVYAVSKYMEDTSWLEKKPQSIRNEDAYYSKDSMINYLNDGISKTRSLRLPKFTDLFIAYSQERISKTRIKAYDLKSLVTKHIRVYTEMILLLPNDIGEGIEDDIISVITKTAVPVECQKIFIAFLNFAFVLENISPKKEFANRKIKNKDDDSEIEPYSPEIYQAINLHVRELEEHIPKAVKSPYYANMWVYVLLHLTDIWRHTDIVEKVPPVTLEQIGVLEHAWFKENRMSPEQCQKIINELYVKLRPEVTNKTRRYLTFLVEPTLVECVAYAVVISEIHRRKKQKYNLLFTFNKRGNVPGPIQKSHKIFFRKKPEIEMFKNQKMNRSTMTYLHYHIIEEDADNADLAVAYGQQARSHDSPDTARIYMKVMNKDGSINRVTSNLFKRGNFGWLYNYMILSALKGTGAVQSLEERTKTIEVFRGELVPKELEDWAKFLTNKRQAVINQLSKMPKDELIGLVRKIFNQEMPAKTKPGQCMVYPKCAYSSRNNCFGCEYFIPQYYVLIEAAKEFKRLVKSMNEAKYETTFIRDKRALMTVLTIVKEAKAVYPLEQVNGFLSPKEIRMGIESMKSKTFIAIE
ncbi:MULTISPECIES: helix-turn-helix domain-containing protein [Bacillus cereus group]|uniref:helix-turn-helix domain-containing protein n=1 Tax=Bacillus cereus group TaxID=86661 RepID=UPI00027A207C|nr:helix-turn-helix domain-containing protein [Bacillus cereus]EJR42296.1 hypothetical protein IIE_00015 [Bacillus cereus VD045]HDR4348426.1 helix-turn-helix domain-containing protein [Bacillus cereus]